MDVHLRITRDARCAWVKAELREEPVSDSSDS
jgi:hypothetical protein